MGGRCMFVLASNPVGVVLLLPAYPAMPMLCFICRAAFSASQ